MAGSWITVGQLASATDISSAQLVALDGTLTSEAVDARVAAGAGTAVAEYVADNPDFIDAATAAVGPAVDAAIVAEDLVTGTDDRIFVRTNVPGFKLLIDNGETILFAVDDDGSAAFRPRADVKFPKQHPTGELEVFDSTHEWWNDAIFPVINGVLYGAGISSTGDIIAWERDARNGITAQVVGTAVVDDHCAPDRWAMAGHPQLMAWQNHGLDEYLRIAVSDPTGKVWDAPVLVSIGLSCSYAQVYRMAHLSDATQDTFWIVTRRGSTGWGIKTISVNLTTRVVTAGGWVDLLSSPGVQSYFITAMVLIGGVPHLQGYWYPNPSEATHEVHGVLINCITGAVTTPTQAITANLNGTGLPLVKSAITALIPNTAAGTSRRIYYGHPSSEWRLLLDEWPTATPTAGTKYDAKWVAGVVTKTSLGPAGEKIGYSNEANYLGGNAYSPSGARIATITNVAGVGTLTIIDSAGARIVERQGYSMTRPVWISENEVLWSAVEFYGADYLQFKIHQRSTIV